MRCCYMLFHKRFIEIDKDDDEIYTTKILGFFSSKKKCKEILAEYLKLPGFIDYPHAFGVEKVKADIDDYNKKHGEFEESVFYLSHQWDDGEYDHIAKLGFYSNEELAEKAIKNYSMEDEFIEHLEDFYILKYNIDHKSIAWNEGFFTWG